jgi:hypothetical protein
MAGRQARLQSRPKYSGNEKKLFSIQDRSLQARGLAIRLAKLLLYPEDGDKFLSDVGKLPSGLQTAEDNNLHIIL